MVQSLSQVGNRIPHGQNTTRAPKPAREFLVGLNPEDFLFERSDLFFCKLDWTFTYSVQCYINAWCQVVPRTRRFHEQVTPQEVGHIGLLLASLKKIPTLTELEKSKIHPSMFKSLSKTQMKQGTIIPGHLSELCPEFQDKDGKRFGRNSIDMNGSTIMPLEQSITSILCRMSQCN